MEHRDYKDMGGLGRFRLITATLTHLDLIERHKKRKLRAIEAKYEALGYIAGYLNQKEAEGVIEGAMVVVEKLVDWGVYALVDLRVAVARGIVRDRAWGDATPKEQGKIARIAEVLPPTAEAIEATREQGAN